MITTKSDNCTIPPWVQDVIANGIEMSDDRRPLFNVTVAVMMSLVARGWTENDIRNLLQDGVKDGKPKPSTGLWKQITKRRGRKISFHTYDQFLSRAWGWAQDNVAKGKSPNPKRESDILGLAKDWEQATGGLWELTGTELKVLNYVISATKSRRFLYVTCPVRGVADHCGISVKGAWEALTSLRKKEFVVCRSRGQWKGKWKGKTNDNGAKAAIYRLSDVGHFIKPALGALTLSHQNTCDQPTSNPITPLIRHTSPALGAGMSKKNPYQPTGFSKDGPPGSIL
ncbi:hypothetical protein SKC41_26380 [Mycobacterium sp. 050128]|uniref:hypothetical protein n=1 Tax=Mycobacterium sp. 050128 TaxID=3096112 RepID=UPI002EDB180A